MNQEPDDGGLSNALYGAVPSHASPDSGNTEDDLLDSVYGAGPRKNKIRRSIFDIATDPSLSQEDRDKRIMRVMGYDPEIVKMSGSYKPGSISNRVLKPEQPMSRIGKGKGGGWILGGVEGVSGPLRQAGLGVAHLKEALGVGDTPKADRMLTEIFSNIDLENYNKATLDPETGEGKSGSTIAPLLAQLALSRKIPTKGKLGRAIGGPIQQGAILGAAQGRPIRGDESGGSDWGSNTALSSAMGAGTSAVVSPAVNYALNKLAGTRTGQLIGMKAAKGATKIEDLVKTFKEKLGGNKPGNVAKESLASAKQEKWEELDELFAKIGRRSKPGDVNTDDLVRTIDNHMAKLSREGTIDTPIYDYLSNLKNRLTQPSIRTSTQRPDPYFSDRTGDMPGVMLRSPSEAGATFPDMMREYKIAGAKMRGAYDKGGGASTQGAMSVNRGGIEYDIKSAMEAAARKHDPASADAWAAGRGRWQQEFKPYVESDIDSLINAEHPNIFLKSVMADKTGDRLANLSRVPMRPETRAALQSEFADELKSVYDRRIRGPMGEEAGGGPRGVEHMIRGPENAEFVKNVFNDGSGQELADIASRARAADVAGRSINTVGGALTGGSFGGPGGGIGGAIAAYRFMPNFTAKGFYRMMENPSMLRLFSEKYGIPADSPWFQKLIDEFVPKAASQSATSYTGGNPFIEEQE